VREKRSLKKAHRVAVAVLWSKMKVIGALGRHFKE